MAKHKTKQDRIWVTYKDGVYDITDFVEGHPGGSARIMMAAGAAVINCNVLTVPYCMSACTAPACHRLRPDAVYAGSSIDPFWSMYRQHQNPEVHKILEQHRIGSLVSYMTRCHCDT